MTASRRQFTFGALALALAGKASAGGGELLAQQAAAPSPLLRPRFAARRKGAELLVDLTVVNEGEACEVAIAYGSRLGPFVQAFLDIEGERTELQQIVDIDRRELVSRMGPRPRFAPLADASELEIGTYRFAWIPGVPDMPVFLSGRVATSGGSVAWPEEIVSWKQAGT